MPTSSPKRLQLIVSTARSNPEFAQQVSRGLGDDARQELLGRLTNPPKLQTTPLHGPSLRKCSAPVEASNGLSAQLNLFARAVSRVR